MIFTFARLICTLVLSENGFNINFYTFFKIFANFHFGMTELIIKINFREFFNKVDIIGIGTSFDLVFNSFGLKRFDHSYLLRESYF
jgi:hypothetical protein